MSGDKREYDLIFSLGGNCAAAHNILYRGLRKCALPFDWTYMVDEKPLHKFIDGLKNGFVDFLQYDNLQELSEEENKNVTHNDTFHYLDTNTGYRFVNHFHRDIRTTDEYEKVKTIFDRRTKRLLDMINEAESVLLVLNTAFYINNDVIFDFYGKIKEIYPNKRIDFVVLNFGCNKEEFTERESIRVFRYVRSQNNYDFTKTNQEWAFLDDVKLTKRRRDKIMFKFLGYKIKVTWSK